MKNKMVLIAMVMIFSGQFYAQWNMSVSTYQEYNENPFRYRETSPELISSYNLGVEKEFGDFNILYFGSYSTLSKTTDMNYFWHQGGLYTNWSNSTLGAYFEQRINKEEYNYYDANLYSAYFRTSTMTDIANLKFNTAVSYTSYPNLSDFNNLLLNASVVVNKSFETKTTLIGAAIINFKSYKDKIDSISLTGRGMQRGRNSLLNSSSVNITQLELNGRVAQSLFEQTGLAFNINYKKILSGSSVSVGVIESVYGETELYEDPVAQEGFSMGAMLTQIIPFDVSLQAGYFYYDKTYPSQGRYLSVDSFESAIQRHDLMNNFYLTASKMFYLGEEDENNLNLSINYTLVNNNSNSYYYQYSGSLISLKLDYQF